MQTGSKIFVGLTAFMAIVTTVYILATMHVHDAGNYPGVEWAGTTGLFVCIGLTGMLGWYLHITEKRIDVLPQDWEEAEIADNAGMYGFFSASSIWPFAMAMAVALLGIGIAYMLYWLIALGAVMLIYFGTMLNLQYGVPLEKH